MIIQRAVCTNLNGKIDIWNISISRAVNCFAAYHLQLYMITILHGFLHLKSSSARCAQDRIFKIVHFHKKITLIFDFNDLKYPWTHTYRYKILQYRILYITQFYLVFCIVSNVSNNDEIWNGKNVQVINKLHQNYINFTIILDAYMYKHVLYIFYTRQSLMKETR